MRIFLAGLLILSIRVKAQNTEPTFSLKDRYVSSAGLCYPFANAGKHNEPFYGLCYSPSINMLNKYSDFSVAFASHLSGSWHFPTANDSNDYLMFSFPAFIQFNGGHLATHNFYSSFGISVGGGYNFCVIDSRFLAGPLLITAIRFWFLKRSFTLSYMHSRFENGHTLMHELSLQLNIGAYLRDASRNNKISKFVKPFRK